MTASADRRVVIVGAGPVGLLLGCRLHQLGVPFVIVDRNLELSPHSRAIGIHPPSLELLSTLGLVDSFLSRGLKVTGGVAVGSRRVLGRLSFETLEGPYNFALSLPQTETEAILQQRIQSEAPGCLRRGLTAGAIEQSPGGVCLTCTKQDGQQVEIRGRLLVGCDGKDSLVRAAAGISFDGAPYEDSFLMGDFQDNTDFGSLAHIFITRAGLVESFPLPGDQRRWVVATGELVRSPSLEDFVETVRGRTGHDLTGQSCQMLSPFGIQHFLAQRLHSERLAIAGDAAHVMSPIGGQGMNTGWLNAWDLADALAGITHHAEQHETALARYHHLAHRRASVAIRRAGVNTALGRGSSYTAVRNALVWLALHTPARRSLARVFSMRGL